MIGYVAKDKNGQVYLHPDKPVYEDEYEGWFSNQNCLNITEQFPEFDSMSYTDEPIKVEIKLEKV